MRKKIEKIKATWDKVRRRRFIQPERNQSDDIPHFSFWAERRWVSVCPEKSPEGETHRGTVRVMAMLRSVGLKAVKRSSMFFSLTQSLIHRAQSLSVRAFSSAISPPSKAVVYELQGPPDTVTKVIDLPPIEIKENDVCVKMLAAPINPSDINRIEGFCCFANYAFLFFQKWFVCVRVES